MRALLVMLCLGLAAPALAQPKKPTKAQKAKAKALYDEGLRYYNVGEYDRAVEKFKESYVVVAAPLLLFNIAQAYRLAGDYEAALRSYRTYLRELPRPDNKQQVDQAVKICEEKLAAQPEPVRPVEPEQPAPEEVAQAQPEAKPEPDAGSEGEREVDEPARPGRTKKILGLGVGGAGVLLAATGAYFGLQASSQAKEIEEFDGVWDQSWEDKEAAQRRNRVLGPVLVGAGVAAIAGGVFLYILGDREASRAAELAIAPTDGGGALLVSGRF